MAEHTALPWHIGSTNHTELVMGFRDNVEVVIAESDPEIDMPLDEAAANAAFIVTAVNSHEALVIALEHAKMELERVAIDEDDFADTIAEIDAALSLTGAQGETGGQRS